MNLHRAKKADWETINPKDYTTLQRVAAKTTGLVTPANIVTIIGLGIVIYGLAVILHGEYILGLLLLATGRVLDIVDGALAEATKTKSPVGEIFDAAADKAGTIATIVVLLMAQLAPWWVIAVLIAPQLIIPVIAYYKRRKGIKVHPTRHGKVSMACAWVGIVGLVVVEASGQNMVAVILTYGAIVLSTWLGIYAIYQYSNGRHQD